jgi:hypothetical protein
LLLIGGIAGMFPVKNLFFLGELEQELQNGHLGILLDQVIAALNAFSQS